MMKNLYLLTGFLFAFSNPSFAKESVEFDANADCKVQPFGFSSTQDEDSNVAVDPANEVFPEIKAESEPEYVDAENLKALFLELARPVLHDKAEPMIDAMEGTCFSKQNQDLYVSLYFKERYTLALKPFYEAMKMEAYQVEFPKLLRLKISKAGKLVTINFSGRGFEAMQMIVNVPVLSNRTYLHQMVINTETNWIRISSKTMKDTVGVVAWSKFESGAPIIAHIDFKKTLWRLFHPRSY